MTTTHPAAVPAGAAPLNVAAIDRALADAERQWRDIGPPRSPCCGWPPPPATTTPTPPGSRWLWTDQPGTANLIVGAVYNQGGWEITDGADDDCNDVAFNLTESNRRAWQPLLPTDPMVDGYRLTIDTTLARYRQHTIDAPTTTTTDSPGARPRLEVVTYRDPDGDTVLRLFADGTEITPGGFDWCDADLGRGHTLAEWHDTGEWHARRATPAAADAIRACYRDGAETDYIT